MPRFVATVRIGRTYSLWPAPQQVGSAAAGIPAFDPFPTDWIIESTRLPDEDGRPRMSMTATRVVAVLAANETTARDAAIACTTSWRDDVPDSRIPGAWVNHGDDYVEIASIRREAATPRPKGRFEVDLDLLASPDVGPTLLETDRMFELFRWMVATSRNYEQPASYAPITVHSLLKGSSTRWDERIGLVTSRGDLHGRFQAAILGRRNEIYQQWRSEHGIVPGATLVIERPHYGKAVGTMSSEHGGLGLERALWAAMSALPGLNMERSPNSCHARATLIHAFGVAVTAEGFAFRIRYGMDDENPAGPCSSWSHDVAMTRGDEPFYETAERAMALIHRIVPSYRADRRRLAS